jgi:hypothetical protein
MKDIISVIISGYSEPWSYCFDTREVFSNDLIEDVNYHKKIIDIKRNIKLKDFLAIYN